MEVLVWIKSFPFFKVKKKSKIGYSPVSAVRALEEFGLVCSFVLHISNPSWYYEKKKSYKENICCYSCHFSSTSGYIVV